MPLGTSKHVFRLLVLFLPASHQSALSFSIFAKSKRGLSLYYLMYWSMHICHFDIYFVSCSVHFSSGLCFWHAFRSAFLQCLCFNSCMRFVFESHCITKASEDMRNFVLSVCQFASKPALKWFYVGKVKTTIPIMHAWRNITCFSGTRGQNHWETSRWKILFISVS